MRLHTLDLQAIGPYATAQHIDFERLASGGLFLLEGPTGAGKTTILDAITFALYGGLSGDGAGGDRLHSHFAGPDAEPSVTLEFSVRGARYRVRRAPEYQRLRKRGDGYTMQAMAVHLERQEGGRWVSQSSNKKEVGDLITEAVGLNREQFTQVMILPQGEFAKFLRSSDDLRRELLTRLFAAQLYDRITAELERRRIEASRARQAAESGIGNAIAAAAEAAGLDEIAELLALDRAECVTRLKEAGAEIGRQIEVNQAGLQVAATALTTATEADDRARQQVALMLRLIRARDQLAQHEASRPAHERRFAQLAAAQRAEPVRPLLAALDEAQQTADEARALLAALTSDLRGPLLEAQAGLQAGLAAALEDQSDPATALALVTLADGRAREADRVAAELQHLADREAERPAREQAVIACQAAQAAAADRVAELETARRDLPGQLVALDAQLAGARVAAGGLADAAQQQATAGQRLAAAIRLVSLTEQLAELDSTLRDAIDVHQQRVDAYQHAMEARLENMAAELAVQLADGGACPVCGSTDHPGPAAALADAVSAREVSDAADLRDGAADARVQAEEARDDGARAVAACAATAGGGTPESRQAEHAAATERVRLAELAVVLVAELAPQLAGLREQQEKLAEELNQAIAVLATAVGAASRADTDLAQLAADLTAAAQDYPSVAARQAALVAAARAGRSLAHGLAALATARNERDAARSRAEHEVDERGLDTLTAARCAVLATEDQAVLRQQVTSWISELAALAAAAGAGELSHLDPAGAGETDGAALAAAAALALARDADQEARDAHQSLASRDQRLRLRMAELDQAQNDASALIEETETVVRLAALARGMDGHRRMALTTYVLRRWFARVVEAANLRLAAMSAGRYELRRTDEGEKKRERTGLTLTVIDRHTGAERSPASLSGGETFYTSLALALGLADVVRAEAGGVELDTLFIDEGFGSLDADTLDQVMAVIDDLRDRGRAVGIVSHVADLKDRVQERLEVRRLPDGSSMLTVVA